MDLLWLILFCTVAYFIGSVNFAIIYAAWWKRKDPRKIGSGNAGATNLLRAYGFKVAISVLILDVIKGVVPALVAMFVFRVDGTSNGLIALYAVGLATVVGHSFPIYYRFRGGKGVACTLGVFLVANPLVAFIVFIVGLIYVLVMQYSAVSSLLFVTFLCVYQSVYHGIGAPMPSVPGIEEGGTPIYEGGSLAIILILFAFMLLNWFTHRKNIQRLLTGFENRAKLLKKLKRASKENQAKTDLAELADWALEEFD